MAKWLTHRFAKPTRAGSTPALDSNILIRTFVVRLGYLVAGGEKVHQIFLEEISITCTEAVSCDSRPGLILYELPCGSLRKMRTGSSMFTRTASGVEKLVDTFLEENIIQPEQRL